MAKMKIMIIAHGVRAGGGRVTCLNILNALVKIDQENEYCMILPDQPEYREAELEDDRRDVIYFRRRCGPAGRLFFDQVTLISIVKRYAPDVIWAMGGFGLSKSPVPQAISIQNPYYMYEKEYWGQKNFFLMLQVVSEKYFFQKQLANTHLVIFQTATMEKRLLKHYGYHGRTHVTWKAVSFMLTERNKTAPNALLPYAEKYKFFYVTRYYPHKGLEQIVETYSKFSKSLSDTVTFITIDANQHSKAARILENIREKGLEDKVVNLGPLPQKDLADYFTYCDALLMPTLLESFSGTHLEAMHFGLPILTSDLDFAREVCEDAALYFDPWDTSSIKDAILKIKNDPDLAGNLRVKGMERLNGMQKSWDEIAAGVLHELEKMVAERGQCNT
jgi:glycosyltransferase involved in cell wall biosynthesis